VEILKTTSIKSDKQSSYPRVWTSLWAFRTCVGGVF